MKRTLNGLSLISRNHCFPQGPQGSSRQVDDAVLGDHSLDGYLTNKALSSVLRLGAMGTESPTENSPSMATYNFQKMMATIRCTVARRDLTNGSGRRKTFRALRAKHWS